MLKDAYICERHLVDQHVVILRELVCSVFYSMTPAEWEEYFHNYEYL